MKTDGKLAGVVVKSIFNRGFCFIRRDDGQGDAFGHITEFVNPPEYMPDVGTRVRFDLSLSRSGEARDRAVNIEIA